MNTTGYSKYLKASGDLVLHLESDMTTNQLAFLREIYQLINQNFSLNEIQKIVSKLNTDHENVSGDDMPLWVGDVLLELVRKGLLSDLLLYVRTERPNVLWPAVPDDLLLPDIIGDQFSNISIMDSEGIAFGAGASVNIQKTIIEKQVFIQSPVVKKKKRLEFEPETCLIPAGEFIMGDEQYDPNEAPQTLIDLPAYHIGVYPVTNEEYAHFIMATRRVAPKELLWDSNFPSQRQLNVPVFGVSWIDAIAYCKWLSQETGRSYTLPNEAQWEKAARGVNGHLYPWGNEWEADRCNTNSNTVTAKDAFPAQSVFGCFDMVGNLREWTTTLWGDDAYQPDSRYQYPWRNDGRDFLESPYTIRRIFRGGCWDELTDYRCSKRSSYLPERSGPRRNRHGFRVIQLIDSEEI